MGRAHERVSTKNVRGQVPIEIWVRVCPKSMQRRNGLFLDLGPISIGVLIWWSFIELHACKVRTFLHMYLNRMCLWGICKKKSHSWYFHRISRERQIQRIWLWHNGAGWMNYWPGRKIVCYYFLDPKHPWSWAMP